MFLCMFASNLRELFLHDLYENIRWGALGTVSEGRYESFPWAVLPILRLIAQLWYQATSWQELGGRLRTGYFYQIDSNHETLSPTVNVKGYLLKTLRHKLYDTIEKNRKMEDISLYEDTFQTDELFSRISLDTTEADERVKLLMKALTKLSPTRERLFIFIM